MSTQTIIQKSIQITNEDNMELMARYEDDYFDLAIVDIPYGLGDKLTNGGTWAAKYKKGDADWDILPKEEYFKELLRVSKNQIIWGGNYAHKYLPSNRHFIIWDKVSHMPTMADCEYAWSSFDENAKIYKHPRNTNEKRIHITQKPISLYQFLLTKYAKQGDKILDTHVGSGSIAIAVDSVNKVEKMHLTLIGCEISKDYYDKAMERIKAKTSWQSLF